MVGVLDATRGLLDTLDPLAHPDRMRRLAGWARTAPDRAGVCVELRAGDPYQRHLALVASLVVRDTAGLDAATRDPHPGLRAFALTAALRAGRLTGRVRELAAMDRRRIYRTLRVSPAPAIADDLITEIRACYGDAEAAMLLPACGASVVRTLLPHLAHAARLDRLARRHPEILRDHLAGVLAATPPARLAAEWERLAPGVFALPPEQALDLLERHSPEDTLPDFPERWSTLAQHDPARVLRLATTPARSAKMFFVMASTTMLRRLARLSDEELAPFARQLQYYRHETLLRVLPPARRAAVYALSGAPEHPYPNLDALDLLPAADRAREVNRRLATFRESPVRELLPWPEASAALEEDLRSADAGDRREAYAALIDAARRSRDPQVLVTVVERLDRLRNEPDPARRRVIEALARAVPLFTDAAVPALTRFAVATAEARDTSAETTEELGELATATLRHHMRVPELRDWALLTIGRASGGSREPSLGRFDQVLHEGQETLVLDALRDWVVNNLELGRCGPLLTLTAALGRRAWRLPELQELLRRATGPHVSAESAREAAALWLADPRTRRERVAELLAADPSAATIPAVWRAICADRTDLLDRVLPGPAHGRFAEAGTPWTPPAPIAPERWLPRQHAAYVSAMESVLADTRVDVWQRAAAVHAAGPAGEPGRALVLRHTGADEVPVAEAALGALVHTDRPDLALPVLLAHAGDDRARVAMYAADRAAGHLPPAALTAPFEAILTGEDAKITSRKEAVRILARHGPAGTMERLLALYRPELHRDVRAAIAGVARWRLDVEASWAVLDSAIAAGPDERGPVLYADPARIAEPHRPRYAAMIVAACRSTDANVRYLAYGRLADWSRWAGDLTGLIVDRLTDLTIRAYDVSVTPLLAVAAPDVAGRVLTILTGLPDSVGPAVPGTVSDHPARRRIETIARAVAGLDGDAHRPAMAAAMLDLAARPEYRTVALAALVPLGRLGNLVTIAELCAGRPVLAVRTADRLAAYLATIRWTTDIDPALVSTLAGRGDLAGGLFAVKLAQIGAEHSDEGTWKDAVLRLREHPEAEVRDEALGIDVS